MCGVNSERFRPFGMFFHATYEAHCKEVGYCILE